MSEEKGKTPMAVGEKPADEKPAVDLAMQNEQTVAQTNAINDAVKAAQVSSVPCDSCTYFQYRTVCSTTCSEQQ